MPNDIELNDLSRRGAYLTNFELAKIDPATKAEVNARIREFNSYTWDVLPYLGKEVVFAVGSAFFSGLAVCLVGITLSAAHYEISSEVILITGAMTFVPLYMGMNLGNLINDLVTSDRLLKQLKKDEHEKEDRTAYLLRVAGALEQKAERQEIQVQKMQAEAQEKRMQARQLRMLSEGTVSDNNNYNNILV